MIAVIVVLFVIGTMSWVLAIMNIDNDSRLRGLLVLIATLAIVTALGLIYTLSRLADLAG